MNRETVALLTEPNIAIAVALGLIAILYSVQFNEAYETPNRNSADFLIMKHVVIYQLGLDNFKDSNHIE